MTITCRMGDIRTNTAIWNLIGRAPGDAVCTLLGPVAFADAYMLNECGGKRRHFPNGYAYLMRHEQKHLYHIEHILEYDFRILVPALNGYFCLAAERKDHRKLQLFPADRLHFYAFGSDTPDVLSLGELYNMAAYFLTEGCIADSDEAKCIIEAPETPAPSVWCKLRNLEEALRRTVAGVHANCELFELEELREPDSCFCQYAYDYEVEIPALGLCFRYGREAEVTMSATGSRFAWIDDCLLVFDASNRRYLGSCYDSVAAYADWYYREHPHLRHRYGIRPDAIADLDCRIELPYRIRRSAGVL